MQQIVAQMKIDDINDDPSSGEEYFTCDCCGAYKQLAGSIQYTDYRLCNDCVLIAETGFALKKLSNIDDLIKAMEDTRLRADCDFLLQDENRANN